MQSRGGRRLRLTEDEARTEQVRQCVVAEVVRVLGHQPDGGVVLAAVPDAVQQQSAALEAGGQVPGLIEKSGREAARVGERDMAGDRGHEIQDRLGEDLLDREPPCKVLPQGDFPVGQADAGGMEDEIVGVEPGEGGVLKGEAGKRVMQGMA